MTRDESGRERGASGSSTPRGGPGSSAPRGGAGSSTPRGGPGSSASPGSPPSPPGAAYSAVEVELRQVQVRADGLRDRMRAAIDMFGLLTFGLALLGLAVVATLAIVAFTQDETGVGMLFSALTIVALPMVGVAAWRAFSPLWGLARELRVLRRREAALYERLATEHAPPPAVHEEPGDTFVPPAGGRRVRRGGADSRLPPGNTPTGWRERPPTRPRRGRSAALWSLVGVGVFLLLLIIGIALGASTRT